MRKDYEDDEYCNEDYNWYHHQGQQFGGGEVIRRTKIGDAEVVIKKSVRGQGIWYSVYKNDIFTSSGVSFSTALESFQRMVAHEQERHAIQIGDLRKINLDADRRERQIEYVI